MEMYASTSIVFDRCWKGVLCMAGNKFPYISSQ